MPRTIHFVSLGCAKNRVDTEVMLGVSDNAGFQHVGNPEDAEVVVVNTCGFIGPAKEESIETILEMAQLKDAGTCKQLVVTGCLAQRYADDLAKSLPEVDHFLGSSDMLRLAAVLQGKAPRVQVGNPADYVQSSQDPRLLSQRGYSAYLKIAEGCNRRCSFCAIPSIRGLQRSRSVRDLTAEAQRLADQGVRELNLVSQDTIAYGRDRDERPDLSDLLESLGTVSGIEWIRLHYLYPETLKPRLIELLRDHPRILPYIDMPLQHVSDPMLRRMRRGHGGDRIYKVVERLRNALPDRVFRTTFVVGHPGETASDFEELMRFVAWAEFDHVGVFQYSHEEGTHAGDMEHDVDAAIALERCERLMDLQREISRRRLSSRVGERLKVLVEGISEESELLLEGRYWGQAADVDGTIYLANGSATPGSFREVLVTAATEYDLVADMLSEDGVHDTPEHITFEGSVHTASAHTAIESRPRVRLPVL